MHAACIFEMAVNLTPLSKRNNVWGGFCTYIFPQRRSSWNIAWRICLRFPWPILAGWNIYDEGVMAVSTNIFPTSEVSFISVVQTFTGKNKRSAFSSKCESFFFTSDPKYLFEDREERQKHLQASIFGAFKIELTQFGLQYLATLSYLWKLFSTLAQKVTLRCMLKAQ